MTLQQGSAIINFPRDDDLPRKLRQLESNSRDAASRLDRDKLQRGKPVTVQSAGTYRAAPGDYIQSGPTTGVSVELPTPTPQIAGTQIWLSGPFDAVSSPGALVDAAASIAPSSDILVVCINDGTNWKTTWA